MKESINKMKFSFTMVLAIAFLFTFSQVTGKTNFQNFFSSSVVHAATENILETDETLTQFFVNENDSEEHWVHTLSHDGKILLPEEEIDTSDLTYIVKLPDELSHLLEDQYVLDYLNGEITNFDVPQNAFFMSGEVIDEDGNTKSLQRDDNSYEYLTINKDTNSIEFDIHQFLTDNEYELPIKDSLADGYYINLGFETSLVVPNERILYNGTYEFKTALIEGDTKDLDEVSSAYPMDLEIDYSSSPEPEVDKDRLENLIDEANDIDEEAYTEDSFTALSEAIAESEEILADEDATQDDVDNATSSLQDAIDALEEKPTPEPEVDKDALENLINEANEIDEDAYTEDSFAALTEAIAESEDVLANEDATQDEVDETVVSLQDAIDALEEETTPEPEVDKDALENLINEANEIDEDAYTEDSFAALTETIAESEEVLADEDATQDEVDNATNSLQDEIDALEEKPTPEPEVDKSALQDLVDEAKEIDGDAYTEDSFSALTETIAESEEVLADEDATQDEVDEAVISLQDAIDALEEKTTPEPEVDKSALQDLVDEAKEIDGDAYTDESFSALANVISDSDAVLTDEDATQDEVDETLRSLEDAIDNLSKEPEVSVEDDEANEEDEEEGNKLPETATPYFNMLVIGFIALMIGIIGLVYRRFKLVK